MRPRFSILLALAVAVAGQVSKTCAQGFANCSRAIAPNGQVSWICPPATAQGNQWRASEFIPACLPGMA